MKPKYTSTMLDLLTYFKVSRHKTAIAALTRAARHELRHLSDHAKTDIGLTDDMADRRRRHSDALRGPDRTDRAAPTSRFVAFT